MDLENKTEKFIRADKVIGNTVVGAATGIATVVAPEFPLFLQIASIGGYNVLDNPSEPTSIKRVLGELAGYTAYGFAVKYVSNEIIQYAISLMDQF